RPVGQTQAIRHARQSRRGSAGRSPLSGRRPEINDADRLQALRADLVAGKNASGLLLDLVADLPKAITPGADVEFPLPPLLRGVEIEAELRVIAAAEIALDAPALCRG